MKFFYLILAIFLFITCPRIILRGIFYNKITREWEGKKWQYNTAYVVLSIIFFYLCSLPLIPGAYVQIANFCKLAIGKCKFVECQTEHEEVSENLSDEEFILVYEVLGNTSYEKIEDEIIPEIIDYQGKFSDWHVFFNHDFRLKNYSIQYNSEKKMYLVYVGQKVVADIEVKNTVLLKKIYFHGYWEKYNSIRDMEDFYEDN